MFNSVKIFLLFLGFCTLLKLGTPCTAHAEHWQANLKAYSYLPEYFVVVSKADRLFFLYENGITLRLKYVFPCTTGQKNGDKQAINDLRTPEGLYFVEKYIPSGLDFRDYGGSAYTLNYPNPVDKTRGKTGYGIWIHSKGYGLVPTKGCVAISLDDLQTVGTYLTPGTPILIAETLEDYLPSILITKKEQSDPVVRKILDLAQNWHKENCAYTQALHISEGPGYWVTWTDELRITPQEISEGIRRLYWQIDESGQIQLAGMTWQQHKSGMLELYQILCTISTQIEKIRRQICPHNK